MAYLGAQPNKTLTKTTSQSFNGTGSATVFTLNRAVNTEEELEVFVENVQQEPGSGKSYTATGTTLTFDEAPPSGTGNIYVIYRGLAEVTTRLEHDANQALSATTGTFTQLNSDNIRIDGNTISSTDTNGDITIDPNGTGNTIVASGDVGIGVSTITTGTLGTSNTFIEAAGPSGGAGTLVLSRDTTTDNDEVGGIRFVNRNNADDDGLDADGKLIANINARIETSDSNAGDDSGGHLIFSTKPEAGSYAERMRIDSGGGVRINNTRTTSVPFHVVGGTGSGTSYDTAVFAGGQNSTNGSGAKIYITGCENDPLTRGTIIEGIMVNNSNAHQLRFSTNAGASAPVERLRISHTGQLTASTTEYFASLQNSNDSSERSMHYNGQYLVLASHNDVSLILNRMGNDGSLVHLRQAGTVEGTISVSGSTVSFNGGHLSRWSQLTDGTKDTTIVKGTVMTNLDQMAVWSHDEALWTADDELPDGVSVGDVKTAAYTEDNEQLNCMTVSSVEGDANVAGVFVNWDYDDDDFNDMNVAMTGDMVIRIASGTTVARGDLLMSAGDGTAKPQGDDIVRSKTIAKVTSTNVSHTYDDGSYLVPCVLMAC